MSFTSNKETKKYNNIRKIKYSTTEIKYTRWEQRIAQRKKIENCARRLNLKRRTYQNLNFFFHIKMIISEKSLNERTQKKRLEIFRNIKNFIQMSTFFA